MVEEQILPNKSFTINIMLLFCYNPVIDKSSKCHISSIPIGDIGMKSGQKPENENCTYPDLATYHSHFLLISDIDLSKWTLLANKLSDMACFYFKRCVHIFGQN